MRKRSWLRALALVFLLPLACAFGEASELDAYDSPEITIGVPTGSAAMNAVEARFPNATKQYITVDTDGYLALKTGKIDAFAHETTILLYACEDDSALRMLDESFGVTDVSVGISRNRGDLKAPVDAFIQELIDSGIRNDMKKRWMLGKESAMPELPVPETPDKTLRVGTSGIVVPMTYYGDDGALTGFDIEMLKRMAYAMNAKLDVSVMNYDALVAGLESGKLDLVVANLNITPERAERINYSIPYISAATGLVVRNEQTALHSMELHTLADLQAYFGEGMRIGVATGTVFDEIARDFFPDAKRVYVNTSTDLIVSLQAGKIDGYLVDKPQGIGQCASNDQLWMPDIQVMEDRYGIALAFGNEALCEQMNEVLHRFKAEGELDRLGDKWFLRDESLKPMPETASKGEKGTLQLATDADIYPFSYIRDGKVVGYSIELFQRICDELGYGCEVDVSDFTGVIAAVSSGKVDAAASTISITEERKEQMLFTEPIYDGGVMMMLPSAVKPAVTAELDTPDGVAAWLTGKRIGMYIGASQTGELMALTGGAEMVWINNYADMVVALNAGRIDAFWCETPIAQRLCKHSQGLYTSGVAVIAEDYGFAMKPGNDALAAELNATIRRLEADGSLEQLREKWTNGEDSELSMPDVALTGENGTLRIATDAEDAPFGYMANGKLIGYDYELLTLFAQEHGYRLEYTQLPWDALPAAVISGKCDIACGCLSITGEHAESLLMSDATYHGGLTLVTSDRYAPTRPDESEQPEGVAAIWASISASFERTFIRESRWKLIVQGLGTTILISVCAALLGTLLGFGVCVMRRSRYRALSAVAKAFIRLMQGTPIVVFLMILYYVVFGDVDPVLVAVIGFALNFAAYISEMMRTGIEAVDKGQIEAASAIGFTRTRAFLLITLPQAARHFLPVFRGEFISLVKMTSVVGYISIMDLTKMSDIIRSRTYEAFFPLIATAVIYFLLSSLLAQCLSAIELRIDPKLKKRVVRGVKEEEPV